MKLFKCSVNISGYIIINNIIPHGRMCVVGVACYKRILQWDIFSKIFYVFVQFIVIFKGVKVKCKYIRQIQVFIVLLIYVTVWRIESHVFNERLKAMYLRNRFLFIWLPVCLSPFHCFLSFLSLSDLFPVQFSVMGVE